MSDTGQSAAGTEGRSGTDGATDTRTFVIVGAGLAGAKAAETLRSEGFAGRLILVGTERERPYERPPLSKGFLNGSDERGSVFVHEEQWYADHQVELRLDTPAVAIDRSRREVVTGSGERLSYDRLLLATGAEPRRLTVPGADLEGVAYLRTLQDSERLKAAFTPGARVVVIGAGWIGLETAAAARAAGAEVTVVEMAALPLLRVLGPEVAQVFADLHSAHGVVMRFGATVQAVRAGTDPARAASVLLGDGTALPADLVVVGVGVTPLDGLARSAGLAVGNGVLVDEHLQSSDPAIVAAGDVANAFHPLLRRQIRVEHWANALHQGPVAAATMLGRSATYDRLPYFFTDQFELGMEYTGYAEYAEPAPGPSSNPAAFDQVVVRGTLSVDAVAGDGFMVFWLREGKVLAGMHVNVWDTIEQIEALIRSGARVDPARLGDPELALDQVAG